MKAYVAVLCLIFTFLFASLCLYFVAKEYSAVILHHNTKSESRLKFPSSLDDLKDVTELIKYHKDENLGHAVLLFCSAYLYKQTFAIPGSVFMNILGGAIFGMWYGFPLVCLLTATGATFCYLLSKHFGKSIFMHLFPKQLAALQKKVDENNDGLMFFLLCLRLFPMSPNWFLNMASPILNVPIHYFFPSVFLGLMPYNFICCQAGCILSEITSPVVLYVEQSAKWNIENKAVEAKLKTGFTELHNCNYEVALKIFDEVSQESPKDGAWLGNIGKAITNARKDSNINNKSATAAVDYLEKAANSKPDHPLVLQTQAEIEFRSGKLLRSLETAKKLIDKYPTGHALVLAGIIAYKNNLHYDAVQYLNKALKYEAGNQPVVHQALGHSYMALGMVKKSIEALLDSLEMDPDNTDALKAVSSGFKELGYETMAMEYINNALKINDQDAKAHVIKGHINFSTGKIKESLENYQACLNIERDHYGCQYMKALSLATLGRFYDSVKASTKVMISNFGAAFVPEYSQSFYLREFARYLHSRLDTPLREYRFESDLSSDFREFWIKNLPWNVKNYTEQPGIQPHISDVEKIPFENLSNDTKVLLCKAATYEELLQYHSDGFMPNWRLNKAMALGLLDVAQTALQYWKSPVSLRGWKGKRFTWRDIFDVSLKWRKLVSIWYPALWLDLFPKNVVESGMSNQVLLTVGNHQMPRFMPYFPRIFDLAKSMIKKIFSQKLNAKAQEQLEESTNIKEFVSVLRKASVGDSFAVALQIPSSRRKTSMLDGVLVTISGQRQVESFAKDIESIEFYAGVERGSPSDDMSFLLESISKPVRTNQFHSELEYLWGKLADDVSRHKSKDPQNDINTIITMMYYFYNFVPLSKGSSAVAYTVAVGLLFAIGQEVTGPIPIEKQPDLEAILSSNPETFIKTIQRWLGLKRVSSQQIQSLPSVAETFPTARSVLEGLNAELDHKFCKQLIPGYSERDPETLIFP
eukprot:gene17542-19292_t